MRYREANPLPEPCKHCFEPECDVCEHGLERFIVSELDEARMYRKVSERIIQRETQKIIELDERIRILEEEERNGPPVEWI